MIRLLSFIVSFVCEPIIDAYHSHDLKDELLFFSSSKREGLIAFHFFFLVHFSTKDRWETKKERKRKQTTRR